MTNPQLPTHFPCWVRAVYSWGGESKQDLGFIEGDLIECLNAGDGMWWMGRLQRDRRTVGLFPSNFVKVLDDSYQPTVRANPNIPSGNNSRSNSQNNSVNSRTSKSVFRAPFKSYALAGAPNPEAAAREIEAKKARGTPSPAGSLNQKMKTRPYSSMHKSHLASTSPQQTEPRPPSPKIPAPIARGSSPLPPHHQGPPSRGPSPAPQQYHGRAVSPLVPPHHGHTSRAPSPAPQQYHSRAASPLPPQHQNHTSRAPSPLAPLHHSYSSRAPSPPPQQHHSRASSPMPAEQHYQQYEERGRHYGFTTSRDPYPLPQEYDDVASSPPPPPPPSHRVAYNRQASPRAEYDGSYRYEQQNHYPPRTPSPAVSGRSGGMTPSPLRDAMNDVMSSLEGMSMSNHDRNTHVEQAPVNSWSPEAFDEIYQQQPTQARPQTSMGFGQHDYHDEVQHEGFQEADSRLASYVERMEEQMNGVTEHDRQRRDTDQDEYGSIPRQPVRSYAQFTSGSSHASSSTPSTFATSQVGPGRQNTIRTRKSAIELGRSMLQRTMTTKSSVTTASSTAQSTSTNTSNSTAMTSQSLMSGYSASGFSATSAGSLARRKFGRTASVRDAFSRPKSVLGVPGAQDALSTVSYHSSHDSEQADNGQMEADTPRGRGQLGGLSAPTTPAAKKRGFFGKVVDTVKTSAATVRSKSADRSGSRPPSRARSFAPQGISSESSRPPSRSAAQEMGLGGGTSDWVNMRRDVNRSNSLSRNERNERIERCQLADIPVLTPVETLNEIIEGDEADDGGPVREPMDLASCNLAMVDKSARFVNNLPALINSTSLAQGYLCRPYKSDVQRLRAIFTWVAERIAWEEDFEGNVDTRRVIQSKRGCSEEIAVLVAEMCSAAGLHVEIVRGHLKIPGELNLNQDLNDAAAQPNHWWNAVIADGEWRILDCSLANPTNQRRSLYSSAGNQCAEGWWFLARPSEICYTHVPLLPEQQHIVPSVAHDVLMALPIASPPYFKNQIQMWDFDTSLLNLEGLEMASVQLSIPEDIECVATVSARAFAQDADGDFFESGDFITRPALAQGEFVSVDPNTGTSSKRYTIKAFVPTTGGNTSSVANNATLNIYAGRRGLMHSINSNPHPLALSLPLTHHGGQNPDFEFFTRHPTPHALRHELYVAGPLCRKLAVNNTFVFAVRQHPASSNWAGVEKRPSSQNLRAGSSLGIVRPGSAMSMASISVSGSAYSNPSATGSDGSGSGTGGVASQQKPAKLAMQSPSGKILRMTRKVEQRGRAGVSTQDEDGVTRVGSTWETVIKMGERGTWRALVLADRSARWCVFGEWECV